MHIWGDGFNFSRLGKVINNIERYVSKRAYNAPMMKEKYGTIRYEYMFGFFLDIEKPIHWLLYPGHVFIRYDVTKCGELLKFLDKYLTGPALKYSKLGALIHRYQKYIFDRALLIEIKRCPDLIDEITMDYPFEKGPKVIMDAHLKQWRKGKV